MRRSSTCALVVLACLGAATTARAQETTAVLGLSAEGEAADLADGLTEALREAATWVRGWSLHEEDLPLDVALERYDCEEASFTCMATIAEALDATRVVFGTAESEGADTIVVRVTMYEPRAEEFAATAVERVQPDGLDDAGLAQLADHLWGRLAGDAYYENVVAETETETETDADTEAEAETEQEITRLAPPPDGPMPVIEEEESLPPIPPAALLERRPRLAVGIGVATAGAFLVGGWIYTIVRIDELNEDPGFIAFRRRVPSSVGDVCQEIDDGNAWGASQAEFEHARSVCGEVDVLNVLKWIFPVAGLAAIGAGTFILASELREDARLRATTTLHLAPRVAPDGAALDATLTF